MNTHAPTILRYLLEVSKIHSTVVWKVLRIVQWHSNREIVQAIEGVEMVAMPTILAQSCSYAWDHYPIKDQPTWIQIQILYSGPQEIFKNKFVQMPIHPTFNFVPCSQPKSRHASPNHHRLTTVLHILIDMLRSNTIYISNPTP